MRHAYTPHRRTEKKKRTRSFSQQVGRGDWEGPGQNLCWAWMGEGMRGIKVMRMVVQSEKYDRTNNTRNIGGGKA
jgi:hypothetical protein